MPIGDKGARPTACVHHLVCRVAARGPRATWPVCSGTYTGRWASSVVLQLGVMQSCAPLALTA
eukprot:1718335-Prymnesium_polylepis.1